MHPTPTPVIPSAARNLALPQGATAVKADQEFLMEKTIRARFLAALGMTVGRHREHISLNL
jgi:hypothetical protein